MSALEEDKEIEQLIETLSIRDKEDIDSLKLEIQHLESLVSFGRSETGKMLIEERERQVIKHINKLFKELQDPDMTRMLSSITQLKVAMRDLIDFKGSQDAIEDRQIILDTILKRKK